MSVEDHFQPACACQPSIPRRALETYGTDATGRPQQSTHLVVYCTNCKSRWTRIKPNYAAMPNAKCEPKGAPFDEPLP